MQQEDALSSYAPFDPHDDEDMPDVSMMEAPESPSEEPPPAVQQAADEAVAAAITSALLSVQAVRSETLDAPVGPVDQMYEGPTSPSDLPRPTRSPGGGGGLEPAAMLRWAQLASAGHGLHISDWSASWGDGRAFCAIVSAYYPDEMRGFATLAVAARFYLAFRVATLRAGVAPLLDVDDLLACEGKPDAPSVKLYVSALWAGLTRALDEAARVSSASAAAARTAAASSAFAVSYAATPDKAGWL